MELNFYSKVSLYVLSIQCHLNHKRVKYTVT